LCSRSAKRTAARRAVKWLEQQDGRDADQAAAAAKATAARKAATAAAKEEAVRRTAEGTAAAASAAAAAARPDVELVAVVAGDCRWSSGSGFVPAAAFEGARGGYDYNRGARGLGYYLRGAPRAPAAYETAEHPAAGAAAADGARAHLSADEERASEASRRGTETRLRTDAAARSLAAEEAAAPSQTAPPQAAPMQAVPMLAAPKKAVDQRHQRTPQEPPPPDTHLLARVTKPAPKQARATNGKWGWEGEQRVRVWLDR
jgi:hypothetical protein